MRAAFRNFRAAGRHENPSSRIYRCKARGKRPLTKRTAKVAYTPTLTATERKAFDWVGNRYGSTGDDMAAEIQSCMPPDAEWSQPGDITFDIPEHTAWEMGMLAADEDGFWPCFSCELANKMQDFINKIV